MMLFIIKDWMFTERSRQKKKASIQKYFEKQKISIQKDGQA